VLARAIEPGATIGVVSPASPPETRAEVRRGISWWESKGYRVKLARGALEQDGWHAGSPEARARDLQEAFADPEIDAIQCMRGGYGSAQVIPLLDFDSIAERPKAFIGASDITALHAALLRYTGLATFYGPGLISFRNPAVPALTGERLLQVLTGATMGPVPHDAERLTVIAIAGGRASGRLVGGCLGDFVYTIGTPWEPDLEGAIFFFEDVTARPGAPLPGADRQAGGRPRRRRRRVRRLRVARAHVLPALEDARGGARDALGVPVLYGLPSGHGQTLVTPPLGVEATVDASALSVTLDEPALLTA